MPADDVQRPHDWTSQKISVIEKRISEADGHLAKLGADNLAAALMTGDRRACTLRRIAEEIRAGTIHRQELVRQRNLCQQQLSLSHAAPQAQSGRHPRLASDFVTAAGTLWLDALEGRKKVPDERLTKIAAELDCSRWQPPADYLEKKGADELKSYNSRRSRSTPGPIRTWSDLVSRGDKDHLRSLRRLLSRCARKRVTIDSRAVRK